MSNAHDDRLGQKWWIDLCFWVVVAPTIAQAIYASYRFYTVCRYVYCRVFKKKSWAEMPKNLTESDYPMVTVQICCYNEYTVIKRTIDAAASIDWPLDRFEVMVCDDSTDETRALVDETAAEWTERGVSVRVFRRGADRTGYKAGMLDAASAEVRGDFILMFDADHIADSAILRRGMGHFFAADGSQDPQIGLVQFPWAYYNLNRNLLTECDGLMLDVAFVMEQKCRGQKLGFFGFNGTGGIWRKEAITAGGGWSWDTITEDLDLSYKAHINGGYKFIFREDTPCALELPASVAAYKGQKRRWSKGFAQVTVKSFMVLMRKRKASLELKIECFFHLTGCVQYVLALWGLMWWPVLRYLSMTPVWLPWLFLSPLPPFLLATLITAFAKASYGNYVTFLQRLLRLRFFLCSIILACGMALNEGSAFIDGLFSKDATFVRTPKEGKPDPSSAASSSAVEEKNDDGPLPETAAGSPVGSEPGSPNVASADAELGEGVVAGAGAADDAQRKKPQYKAPKSVTWIAELALAAYFVAVFVLFVTGIIEGAAMSQIGQIFSLGYLFPALGFFIVGIQEPLSRLNFFCQNRAAECEERQIAVATAAGDDDGTVKRGWFRRAAASVHPSMSAAGGAISPGTASVAAPGADGGAAASAKNFNSTGGGSFRSAHPEDVTNYGGYRSPSPKPFGSNGGIFSSTGGRPSSVRSTSSIRQSSPFQSNQSFSTPNPVHAEAEAEPAAAV